MTLMRPRRPRPNFSRVRHRDCPTVRAAIERQRDRAIGERRAYADWVITYLERVADAHDADARHLDAPQKPGLALLGVGPLGATGHRAVADALRDLIVDLEKGPEL